MGQDVWLSSEPLGSILNCPRLEGRRGWYGQSLTFLSFVKFHSLLDGRDVTEFSYRLNAPSPAGHIICSFILRSSHFSASGPSPDVRAKEVSEIISILKANGIEAVDLSDDEFSKSHLRHLVGGRGAVEHERVVRFGEFLHFHVTVHLIYPLGSRFLLTPLMIPH